jgi:hypothetical protein
MSTIKYTADIDSISQKPVLWIRICIRIHIIFVTWIRDRIHENPDPDQHPDPQQSEMLDPEPDPHQFADDKPKCRNLRLFKHFSNGLSLYLEARIWIRIRIRIRVKSHI